MWQMRKKIAGEPIGLIGMGTEKKNGGDLRLSLSVLIVVSVAFANLVTPQAKSKAITHKIT
jgi:hypothetical protein